MAEHDHIFKWVFRKAENAAGELRAVLPSPLREAIDFASLELLQSDSMSRKLNERFSDAVFRANFRGTVGFVWLLFEHQSSSDHFMVLRVLEHLVRSWVELVHREPGRKSLPPVVCVVLHHGKHKWRGATSLHELVENIPGVVGLERWVPNFHIIVDDLVEQSDEALKSRPLGVLPRVVLWLLRDGRRIRSLFAHLGSWSGELEQLARQAPEDATSVMRYILSVIGDDAFEELQQRIRESAPDTEATMRTAAEALIERGRALGHAEGEARGKAEGEARGKAEGEARGRAEGEARGRAEGEARGKVESVFAVLNARGVVLDAAERTRIAACKDLEQLDRWLRLAVTVSTSAELFPR